MKSVNAYCAKLKSTGELDTNERGNALYRAHHSADRYIIDFADDFTAEGWLQFDTDQDANYFGAWVNPQTLQTLSYAEGDWCLCQCADHAHYLAEVQDMINFYGEGRIALVISADGSAEEIRQDRAAFLNI